MYQVAAVRDHWLRGGDELKPAQQNALIAIENSRDVAVSWPTGFGKSLLFQAQAQIARDRSSIIVVIFPLKALLKEQKTRLERQGEYCRTLISL